jgi:hypothetical protein
VGEIMMKFYPEWVKSSSETTLTWNISKMLNKTYIQLISAIANKRKKEGQLI